MSVINKMLRDLDSRNARATVKKQGVHSVPPQVVRDRRVVSVASGSAVKVLGALLVLVLVAGGLWKFGVLSQFMTMQPDAAPVAPGPLLVASGPVPAASAVAVAASGPELGASVPATLPVSAVASAAASAPVVAAATVLAAASAASAPMAVASRAAAVASAPGIPAPLVAASSAAVPKVVQPPPVPASAKPIASTPAVPAVAASPVVKPPVVPASAPPVDTQRQLAAAEAVASSQTLWNAGSREPAIRLLQDVLLSAERSMAGNGSANLGAGVLALVRELTRMQLADARPGAAWDVLVRLEPQLRNEADLWAVRGNAAQRLGRHQDSVLAYTAALQLRPGEQRWMLGAAVSLAAVGKTEAAADMADKAQAVGPVSRDVQAYLRQMGVPVKD